MTKTSVLDFRKKFWLPHETKSVSFLLLTNVLYVLAKKYPEEFKLHFDTSKRFKIQKGGAFQMITNMSLTNFFETMMNEQNLQDLDGMSLVVKRGASAGNLHKIAIGRCDKQLYFIDPNLKKSYELSDDSWKNLYENVYSVFWWSWPSSKKESPSPNGGSWAKRGGKIKIRNKIKKRKATRETNIEKKVFPEWLQAQARLIRQRYKQIKFGLQISMHQNLRHFRQ